MGLLSKVAKTRGFVNFLPSEFLTANEFYKSNNQVIAKFEIRCYK